MGGDRGHVDRAHHHRCSRGSLGDFGVKQCWRTIAYRGEISSGGTIRNTYGRCRHAGDRGCYGGGVRLSTADGWKEGAARPDVPEGGEKLAQSRVGRSRGGTSRKHGDTGIARDRFPDRGPQWLEAIAR